MDLNDIVQTNGTRNHYCWREEKKKNAPRLLMLTLLRNLFR